MKSSTWLWIGAGVLAYLFFTRQNAYASANLGPFGNFNTRYLPPPGGGTWGGTGSPPGMGTGTQAMGRPGY